MTKTERLLFILNIFRVKKSARIDELVLECNVSRRTIYRDLQALIAMDIPIYCNDGYNLVDEISMPPLNFTREEQELLGYCLMNTPLRRSPRFAEKIRNIELKIISSIPHIKRNSLCNLIVDYERRRNQFVPEVDDIANCCLKALINGSRLKIELRTAGKRINQVKPRALQIREKSWQLIGIDKSTQIEIGIPLEEIEKVAILRAR